MAVIDCSDSRGCHLKLAKHFCCFAEGISPPKIFESCFIKSVIIGREIIMQLLLRSKNMNTEVYKSWSEPRSLIFCHVSLQSSGRCRLLGFAPIYPQKGEWGQPVMLGDESWLEFWPPSLSRRRWTLMRSGTRTMSLLCIPAKFEKQNHLKRLWRSRSTQACSRGHHKPHSPPVNHTSSPGLGEVNGVINLVSAYLPQTETLVSQTLVGTLTVFYPLTPASV